MLEKPLAFVPYTAPLCDFLLTTEDNPTVRNRLLSLGAYVVEKSGYTAYVWNSRLTDRFFIGSGVVDGHVLIGPRALSSMPTEYGAGNYVVVNLKSHSAEVYPDKFGLNALYYSDTLVTNRLHLAAELIRKPNVDIALSYLLQDSGLCYNPLTFPTTIQGISLAPSFAHFEINGRKVKVVDETNPDDFETKSPSEYWELIEQGAREVVTNTSAVMEAGFPVFCDLTGGKDSRIVYASAVAAGMQDRAILNTINTDNMSEGHKEDLRIASGLASRFGGKYGDRPTLIGYNQLPVAQRILARRSQRFGTYHWITRDIIAPIHSVMSTPSFRLMGGGGECYRSTWKQLVFQGTDWDADASEENFRTALLEGRRRLFNLDRFERYIDASVKSFIECPGNNIGQKIDSAYITFRNRFHFGLHQSIPSASLLISPGCSPSLLAASRGLPSKERLSGRVIFDLISTLVPEMGAIEFDKPLDMEILESPYNRYRSIGQDKAEGSRHSDVFKEPRKRTNIPPHKARY